MGDRMSEYVTVEQAGNEAMADMIKQRLQGAGIPTMIAPSNLAAVAGAGASFAVSVPRERAEEARELLGKG
jgi:putative signal transducing protein